MAQKAQMKSGCNTNNKPDMYPKKKIKHRLRARTWLFTLNNPEKKILTQLAQNKHCFGNDVIRYLIQEEMGEEKTHHLQGAIQFKKNIEFNTVKSYLPKAHWEKSRSLYSSFKYCGKLDTRCGEIFTFGDVEKYIEIEEELESTFLNNLNIEMRDHYIWGKKSPNIKNI